ncbi:hypothetical protein [uncultured Methanospirillum sp.]|uniref:hypothetical protein n=1 Tax=uncultured Methanospirillum sp. TaxID=262503 RepID=UPI0029C68D9F|nr:hypothetical protein [uncultured Methanospirillum sp.]
MKFLLKLDSLSWALIFGLLAFTFTSIIFFNEGISSNLIILITSAFISALIAILIVDYTYKRNNELDQKKYFKLLYSELKLIFNKGDLILSQIDQLNEKWKKCEPDQWIHDKHPKPIVGNNSQDNFFYQFFPNHIFISLCSKGHDTIIKGFNPESNNPQYHELALFYLFCSNTNRISQYIEDEINRIINIIQKKYPNPNDLHRIIPTIYLENIPGNNTNKIRIFESTSGSEIDRTINRVSLNILNNGPITWEQYLNKQKEQLQGIFGEWSNNVSVRTPIIFKYKSLQFNEIYNDLILDPKNKPELKVNLKYWIIFSLAIIACLFWTIILVSKNYIEIYREEGFQIISLNPLNGLIYSGIILFIVRPSNEGPII